ncbi:helix-turn-helix domain-containing protein [Agreia sp. Leaf283]|uniref:helix-turn-helix domain-containing protein n=1 Tax=Agreia sp. Leaf283 TaxID=1736321 RepID=UPI0006F385B1|nr:helix-turn-helix domain-containing protein [Agreia sp. Leaf283]KQP54727.1 hypothetical protein ASF51_15720 [Agreia sp. Leaf283]
MIELINRTNDPEAAKALSIIAQFDAVLARRGGISDVMITIADVAGHPVTLLDEVRGMALRCDQNEVTTGDLALRPSGGISVDAGRGTWLILETQIETDADRLILERAVYAIRTTMDRERTANRAGVQSAAEVASILTDQSIPDEIRHQVARRSGLRVGAAMCAVVIDGDDVMVSSDEKLATLLERVHGSRVGVGRPGSISDLPLSLEGARVAYRFTALNDGDHGRLVVRVGSLGALETFARLVARDCPPIDDVDALERTRTVAPWADESLNALADALTLREAAEHVGVHHSTFSNRVETLRQELGWDPRTADGRFRLQLTLAMRRLMHR